MGKKKMAQVPGRRVVRRETMWARGGGRSTTFQEMKGIISRAEPFTNEGVGKKADWPPIQLCGCYQRSHALPEITRSASRAAACTWAWEGSSSIAVSAGIAACASGVALFMEV